MRLVLLDLVLLVTSTVSADPIRCSFLFPFDPKMKDSMAVLEAMLAKEPEKSCSDGSSADLVCEIRNVAEKCDDKTGKFISILDGSSEFLSDKEECCDLSDRIKGILKTGIPRLMKIRSLLTEPSSFAGSEKGTKMIIRDAKDVLSLMKGCLKGKESVIDSKWICVKRFFGANDEFLPASRFAAIFVFNSGESDVATFVRQVRSTDDWDEKVLALSVIDRATVLLLEKKVKLEAIEGMLKKVKNWDLPGDSEQRKPAEVSAEKKHIDARNAAAEKWNLDISKTGEMMELIGRSRLLGKKVDECLIQQDKSGNKHECLIWEEGVYEPAARALVELLVYGKKELSAKHLLDLANFLRNPKVSRDGIFIPLLRKARNKLKQPNGGTDSETKFVELVAQIIAWPDKPVPQETRTWATALHDTTKTVGENIPLVWWISNFGHDLAKSAINRVGAGDYLGMTPERDQLLRVLELVRAAD